MLLPTESAGFDDLLGHSITYRIALGPHQGRKAFTLQTVPAVAAVNDNGSVAKAAIKVRSLIDRLQKNALLNLRPK